MRPWLPIGCLCLTVGLLAACSSDGGSVRATTDGSTTKDLAVGGVTGDATAGGATGDATAGGVTGDATAGDGAAPPDTTTDPFAKQPDVTLHVLSGSRLQANKRVTSGGTVFFGEWHDKQLQVDCRFRTAADGALRCLPSTREGTGWALNYADSTCSPTAIHAVNYQQNSACVGAPPTHLTWTRECKGRVFPVLGPVKQKTTYFRDNLGGCYAGATRPTAAVGAELTPATFVAATLVDGPAQGAVVPRYYVATDGARAFSGWWNKARNASCTFRRASDGSYRCICGPAASAAWIFADAACTAPAVQVSTCDPAPSQVAVAKAGCPATHEPREGGAQIVTIYRKESSGCVKVVPSAASSLGSSSYRYHAIGALTPLAQVPAGSAVPYPSKLRVERTGIAVGKLRQSIGDYHDHQRGETCRFTLAADGKLRCLTSPTGWAVWSNSFADGSCTKPLASPSTSTCGQTTSVALVGITSTCPHRSRVFSVGGQHTGGEHSILSTGKCAAVSPVGIPMYLVGAEVPPASFEWVP